MATLSVRNFTRRPAPRVPFLQAAESTLPDWEISLVFTGAKRARTLNEELRKKTYVPNVLSYEVGAKSGEVIICLETLAREAPLYELSPAAYCLYLFIHGLLHLKGMAHGVTMEKREQALLAHLLPAPESAEMRAHSPLSSKKSHGTTRRNRHRHRHLPGEAGRRGGDR